MYVEWVRHLKTEKEKEDFYNYVYGSRSLLNRLKEIIEDKEKALDRTEMSIEVYSTPNWEHRQAHKNGNRESLAWLKKLVDLDQQAPPKKE